jgi:ubiquinone/menaquinone biosynthesis C-methylase UbiE
MLDHDILIHQHVTDILRTEMKDNGDKIIAEKILQYTSLSNKSVLEIGCGNGRITSSLSAGPKELIAVDPDFKKVKEAKGNLPGVTFQIASGEDLAFKDETFDLVIFTLSLHHQSSEAAIAEAVRVLKDEGEMLIIEPTIEGEVQRAFSLVQSENQELISAQRSIKNSGLKIQDSEIFNTTWSFDDKEELCQSIFDFFDVSYDTRIAAEIINLVGAKVEGSSIELLDELMIQLIIKQKNP